MVARSNRNSLCGNRRHYPRQRPASDCSGRGFHRYLIGRMDIRKRAGRSRQTIGRAMYLAFAFSLAPLSVSTFSLVAMAAESPAISDDSSYDAALTAYGQGDFATALLQAQRAGEGGNPQAQVLVGHILVRGDTGVIDPVGAKTWFLKAANLGQTDAMLALGELALTSQAGYTPSDALFWLEQASDKDRTDAMILLSEMYKNGEGVHENKDKSHQYLVKAANNGDVQAMHKLGDWHIEDDPVKAVEWYEKAAALGDDMAAHVAAILYVESYQIKPDAKRAAELLSQAANAGIPAAQADYGLVVYQGNGVTRSVEQAAEWFKLAAEGGDAEGRFLYAFTLAKGDGVTQSFEDAYYWLLRAEADNGKSGIEEYDQSREELKKRLEDNVDPDILERARVRAQAESPSPP